MNIEVNYLAIFLSAVSTMLVGSIWYSSMVLGKPWMKLMGYSAKELKKQQSKMGPSYGVSFVAALITAYVLSHVMSLSQSYYGTRSLDSALSTSFWMWVGFIAPVQLTEVLFGSKKWSLFAINTGYQLVSVLVMSIIIALFN